MCFSQQKTPETKTYKPSPSPTTIEPSGSAAVSQEERRKKVQQMRTGIASTIKTSPTGVGTSANLLYPTLTGKTKLGQ